MANILVSIFSIYISLLANQAFAGPWDNKCSAAGKKSQGTCQAAVAKLKGAEGARSSVPGSNDARNNAERLAKDAAAQSGDTGKTRAACEAAKAECEKACDAAKKEAQAQASQNKVAAADVGKIDSTKASQCTTPLMARIAELGAGQMNTASDAGAADKSKEAADGKSKENNAGSGGMPQMPQMPQQSGGDDKGEQQQQQVVNNMPTKLSCTQEADAVYSDCNSAFTGKCLTTPSSPGCETFNARYCNATASAGTVDSANANPNFAYLVKDKQGEGLGSDYCERVVAVKFCAGGNKSQCPSCLALNSAWHGMGTVGLDQARQTCPDDPLFMNPKNSQTASTQSIQSTGGSSMATASVDGRMSASSDGARLDEAAKAEQEKKSELELTTESASVIKVASAKQDVADQYGPSVFSILGSTYRDLCENKRLRCK